MSELDKSSFFDAFNARFLSPKAVAETFVPPPAFADLTRKGHTLIVGPRGSGKTSMLKMLQLGALRSWKGPDAEEARMVIDYTGVFISTDINWQEQLAVMGSLGFNQKEIEAIEDTCITLHVLKALTRSFKHRLDLNEGSYQTAYLEDIKIVHVVSEIADLWRLTLEIKSFEGLERAISNRLTSIGYFISIESLKEDAGRASRIEAENFIMPPFFDLVSRPLEIFDNAVGLPDSHWAFCFDELELAPVRLKRQLIKRLRSMDHKIFFKLSISLFAENSDADFITNLAPSEGDDFRLISLWYAEKRRTMIFTERLVRSVLTKRGLNDAPEGIFGRSFIAEGNERSQGSNSKLKSDFLFDLEKVDPSFKKFFAKYKDKGGQPIMSAPFRKAYQIALFRWFFKGSAAMGQKMSSRSSFKVYTGWDSIVAICEGNPRWIIGIVTSMLDQHVYSKKSYPIDEALQWEVIENARHRFRSKLKTYKVTELAKDKGAFKLLDVIGKYFKSELYGAKFLAEPVNSFRVDEESWHLYREALKAALNLGAIVYIPDVSDAAFMGSVKEKRFRLCYLMATEYKIPLRFGCDRNLTYIIKDKDSRDQIIINFDYNENEDIKGM